MVFRVPLPVSTANAQVNAVATLQAMGIKNAMIPPEMQWLIVGHDRCLVHLFVAIIKKHLDELMIKTLIFTRECVSMF